MPLLLQLGLVVRRRLGLGVLAWFVLSLGAAVASPLVGGPSLALVCTGAGMMKIVATGDDGVQALGAAHLDCPMCMPLLAPPPPARAPGVPAPSPLSYALQPAVAAHIAVLTAAPLPARGPPLR